MKILNKEDNLEIKSICIDNEYNEKYEEKCIEWINDFLNGNIKYSLNNVVMKNKNKIIENDNSIYIELQILKDTIEDNLDLTDGLTIVNINHSENNNGYFELLAKKLFFPLSFFENSYSEEILVQINFNIIEEE